MSRPSTEQHRPATIQQVPRPEDLRLRRWLSAPSRLGRPPLEAKRLEAHTDEVDAAEEVNGGRGPAVTQILR